MKKTIAAEFWLTALGAVAAAWAAYTQLDSVLSASANAALVGTTAGAALASLTALASMLVGFIIMRADLYCALRRRS